MHLLGERIGPPSERRQARFLRCSPLRRRRAMTYSGRVSKLPSRPPRSKPEAIGLDEREAAASPFAVFSSFMSFMPSQIASASVESDNALVPLLRRHLTRAH